MIGRDVAGRILVVDDEPANVLLLERVLEREGHQVATASDGDAAVERLAAFRPDLVLLDLVMPGVDGYGVLEQIRAVDVDLPVIAVTADTSAKARRRALELGASDVLLKPVDRLEVVLRVGNHLMLRRLSDEMRARNRSLTRDVREQTGLLAHLQRPVDGVEDLVLLARSDGGFAWANRVALAARREDPLLDDRLRDAEHGSTVESGGRVLDVRRQTVDVEGARITAVVARDMTERFRTARALESTLEAERQALRRLTRIQELQDNLMRAAAHELRTPLAKMQGAVTVLTRDPTAINAEVVDILARGTAELGVIVEGLLEFQELSEGGDLPLQDRSLRDLVAGASSLLDADLDAFEFGDLDLPVRVEPFLVERAIRNLLVNAVRHTPPGTRVLVDAEAWGDRVVLHVRDDGQGVPDDRKRAIFDPFVQVRPGFANRRGVGLGLALVASVAHSHGGYADVVDAPGGGSDFRLALPAAGRDTVNVAPSPS